MVAGVVTTAVGYGVVLEHSFGRTEPAWIAVSDAARARGRPPEPPSPL